MHTHTLKDFWAYSYTFFFSFFNSRATCNIVSSIPSQVHTLQARKGERKKGREKQLTDFRSYILLVSKQSLHKSAHYWRERKKTDEENSRQIRISHFTSTLPGGLTQDTTVTEQLSHACLTFIENPISRSEKHICVMYKIQLTQ